jgi:hypothetical protein
MSDRLFPYEANTTQRLYVEFEGKRCLVYPNEHPWFVHTKTKLYIDLPSGVRLIERMFYTGLNDKFTRPIFTRDILSIDHETLRLMGGHRLNVLVGLNEGSYMFSRGLDYNHYNTYLWMVASKLHNQCEVIGNYYENSNLLLESVITELEASDVPASIPRQ